MKHRKDRVTTKIYVVRNNSAKNRFKLLEAGISELEATHMQRIKSERKQEQ
ncbi:hypothetical protein [Leptospira borgpetersenii]|uniref:hypothetical protein n=1 Tax=Leptospira borgpetersenii TaxID=174 RepID=UPI000B2C8749|nr:hypothetical protein [Leptospira borgpetersenii]MBE8404264.1 hypothetical protein [Leptospira borgpetersenii serovar Tarassovi]MBE8413694.1 hypothetical protein [Leptospira borgpetersenii serovar Tarassovi]MBE8422768.1 hypothetical protein [Leptospira borgpetersenii serovar Balcanica]MBE8433913.1 hypothetical protein [Leptospira borgpetersenii serovar Tarassovi]MBF3349912.1 hypothetical protein [Leptospira borgpetersenii serovar Balcanica]